MCILDGTGTNTWQIGLISCVSFQSDAFVTIIHDANTQFLIKPFLCCKVQL